MDDDRRSLLPSVSDTGESDADTVSQLTTDRTTSPDHDPVERTKCQTRAAFFFVILTEALERMAFYSLVCNMVLFLNSEPLIWASYHAAFALFTLNGVSYVTTLFGGWLADAVLGKYATILGAFVVYIAGCSVWPALYPYPSITFRSACSPEIANMSHWCAKPHNSTGVSFGEENCVWAVFLMIVIISFGYGSVRVNIIPFGAHQVEHEGPAATRFYFNWLYWFFNIGSLIAFGVMGYVQQEISYFYGYLVPGLTLLVAAVIFVSGSRFYIKKSEVHGSILTGIFSVCKNAIKVSYEKNRRRDIEILTSEIPQNDQVPCCLDYAKRRYGGQFLDSEVNNVKALGRVVLVFASMIPYWTVYYQMQTTFMVQGLHMKLDFNWTNTTSTTDASDFKIPASWLMMFDVIFVILLLPLLDRVIYPRLDRAGYSPSLRLRILIGMLFTVAAMGVAGVVERYRLWMIWHDPKVSHTQQQIIGCTTYYASEMSILWQIPQYAFVGISEIFTSTAGLELAFIAAPPSMKGIIMGLYWFCEGIGSLLGSATIAIFEGIWFPNFDYGNINCDHSPFTNPGSKCHLDFYFFTLAGFQILGILLFIVVAWVLNMGASVPLRVQEHGVTVVRSSDNTPRPAVGSPLPGDVPTTPPLPGYVQRRNVNPQMSVNNSA